MPHFTNDEVVRNWAHGLVTQGQARRMTGGSVRVDAEGVIHYFLPPGNRRNTWGPVVLGRYIAKHKTILLNGDGFTNARATAAQTGLRNRVRQVMHGEEETHVAFMAIIPYAALTAAGVDLETLLPIHVVQDEIEEVWHLVPEPSLEELEWPEIHESTQRRQVETTQDGIRYRVTQQRTHIYINPLNGEERSRNWRSGWDTTLTDWASSTPSFQVWVTPTDDGLPAGWQIAQQHDKETLHRAVRDRDNHNRRVLAGNWGNLMTGTIPTEPGLYRQEQIHHLGACVFSAETGGRRHKFLSAFDQDEPSQMYFLAQLPDRSGATTYDQAVLALAPPLVHKARLEGRRVFRQGDVFAIETNLTDEEVYARAKTRVRREVVLYNTNPRVLAEVIAGNRTEPEILPGETVDVEPCLCCRQGKRRVGWGPKARHALSIYGTGHTATEVVVAQKGVTYVKGTLHHDPALTEPGRQREHVDVMLTEGKWHLGLRNTVPRLKQAARQDEPVAATV